MTRPRSVIRGDKICSVTTTAFALILVVFRDESGWLGGLLS